VSPILVSKVGSKKSSGLKDLPIFSKVKANHEKGIGKIKSEELNLEKQNPDEVEIKSCIILDDKKQMLDNHEFILISQMIQGQRLEKHLDSLFNYYEAKGLMKKQGRSEVKRRLDSFILEVYNKFIYENQNDGLKERDLQLWEVILSKEHN